MLTAILMTGILLLPGAASSGRPAPATLAPRAVTAISNAAASPSGGVLFLASNPDSNPTDPSLQPVVVSWTTTGTMGGTWNLALSAPSTFTPCAWVPVSAVTVSCASASGGTSPVCAGSFALSTTSTRVASGTEPGPVTTNYSVTINFTLQDSWKYVASSCSLPVTYTITAN